MGTRPRNHSVKEKANLEIWKPIGGPCHTVSRRPGEHTILLNYMGYQVTDFQELLCGRWNMSNISNPGYHWNTNVHFDSTTLKPSQVLSAQGDSCESQMHYGAFLCHTLCSNRQPRELEKG